MWSQFFLSFLILLTNSPHPSFVFPDSHSNLSDLEAGHYLPSDSVSGIFSRIYFDGSAGELQTYHACQGGDCLCAVFELEQVREAFYSCDVKDERQVELFLLASGKNEITMVARICYSDAGAQRIVQRFVKKT